MSLSIVSRLLAFFPFPTSRQHKEASRDERGYFTVVSENLSRLSVVRKPNTDCLYKVVSNFIACVTSGKARVEGAIKKRFLPIIRTASQLLFQSFNLLALTNSPAAAQGNKVGNTSASQKDLNNLIGMSMLIKEIANVIQCTQLYRA